MPLTCSCSLREPQEHIGTQANFATGYPIQAHPGKTATTRVIKLKKAQNKMFTYINNIELLPVWFTRKVQNHILIIHSV